MATIVPIEKAQEGYLSVDDIDGADIRLWYQTWGNRDGIPVLFVHGGPGQCVAYYDNLNAVFFDKEKYFVIEVDQRGTGKSEPSVRDTAAGVRHMQLYRGISIRQMSRDYERLRAHLGVRRWLVFGGSWGSTLGLDYAQRYPASCLGLIIRGIFLSIEEEMGAVYSLRAMEALAKTQDNPRYVREFEIFFDVAQREYQKKKAALGEDASTALDPNDTHSILKLYDNLIMEGNREASWKFFAYENNLMEEETGLLDPETIDGSMYAEAQSVAFFEARLFLKGAYESSREELDLLGSAGSLAARDASTPRVPVWVVQGTGDAVCPDRFARRLATRLEEAGALPSWTRDTRRAPREFETN